MKPHRLITGGPQRIHLSDTTKKIRQTYNLTLTRLKLTEDSGFLCSTRLGSYLTDLCPQICFRANFPVVVVLGPSEICHLSHWLSPIHPLSYWTSESCDRKRNLHYDSLVVTRILGSSLMTPGSQASGVVRCQVPGVRYQVSGTRCQVPGVIT